MAPGKAFLGPDEGNHRTERHFMPAAADFVLDEGDAFRRTTAMAPLVVKTGRVGIKMGIYQILVLGGILSFGFDVGAKEARPIIVGGTEHEGNTERLLVDAGGERGPAGKNESGNGQTKDGAFETVSRGKCADCQPKGDGNPQSDPFAACPDRSPREDSGQGGPEDGGEGRAGAKTPIHDEKKENQQKHVGVFGGNVGGVPDKGRGPVEEDGGEES